MTSAETVKKEIERFLRSPEPEVLCITGAWGVGEGQRKKLAGPCHPIGYEKRRIAVAGTFFLCNANAISTSIVF
jgi:hypothetical protein